MRTPMILWVCMVLVWAGSVFFAFSGDFARASYALSSCLFLAFLAVLEGMKNRPLKININNTVNGNVDLQKTMEALARMMKRLGLMMVYKVKEKK